MAAFNDIEMSTVRNLYGWMVSTSDYKILKFNTYTEHLRIWKEGAAPNQLTYKIFYLNWKKGAAPNHST